ncbi:MAG: class I SAM-dependent methyltransferase [Rhodothermales bacterium]
MLVRIGDFHKVWYKMRQGLGFDHRRVLAGQQEKVSSAWSHTSYPRKNWGALPRIAEHWNGLIGDTVSEDFRDFIARTHLPQGNAKAISIACGTGTNELKWARTGAFSSIHAFDVSEPRIAKAREVAATVRLDHIVEFSVASFDDLASFGTGFGVVIAENALHHAVDLDRTVEACSRVLRNDGFLILKDYVGPDRFQWTNIQVAHANRILKTIPPAYRTRWNVRTVKNRIYRTGTLLNRLIDPSEAAASSRIPDVLSRYFEQTLLVPLGGTLLQPVFDDIAHNFQETDDTAMEIVQACIAREQRLIETGTIPSDFVFAIYRKTEASQTPPGCP